ncbi:MAG: SdrD B-like domain-containing protein [Fuerstiella sp.]
MQVLEHLEDRLLLAAANQLGAIEGVVFQDRAADGLTGDDVGQSGVTINLYQDGGNGIFESDNGIAGGDDVLVTVSGVANPAVSGAGGAYSFSGLAAGTYFVEQQAPPTGMVALNDVVEIEITDAQARGTTSLLIDDFAAPSPAQTLQATNGNPASSSVSGLTALGGTRDLFVEVAGVGTTATVDLRANQIPGFADLVSAFGTSGQGTITYDGDSDPLNLSVTDLPATDLTSGGVATGIGVNIGAGSDNLVLTISVFTDLANFSTVSIPIPNTGGASVEGIFSSFDTDFTDIGTGADFTNVRAITMTLDATAVVNSSIVVDVVRTLAPTVQTANFANFTPVTLGGTLFQDQNDNGIIDVADDGNILGSVALTLFRDTDGNGVFTSGTDTQVATTTSTNGAYEFTGLQPDDYIVRVDSGNFNAAGPLEDLRSSGDTAAEADPDDDNDTDDNGAPIGAAVFSQAITLVSGTEPINDDDTDPNTNTTLDFGFFGQVDIQVTKVDNVDPVTAGSGTGNLVYTITAFNDGPLDATGVTISDPFLTALPTGWTLVSAVGSRSTTYVEGTGIWTIGDLDDQESVTLTVTVTVGATAEANTVTNTASVVTVDQPDSNAANDSDSETTLIQRVVDIGVQKSDNADTIIAGSGNGNLIYTVSVVNNGVSLATGVEVTDAFLTTLPAGFTLDSSSATAGTSFNETTGVWTIGELAPLDSRLLTLTLTVAATAVDGNVTNTVVVTGVNETDSNPANDMASEDTTISSAVDIQIEKSDNADTIIAGSGAGNLVYTLTASNNGPSNATGVTVRDAFLAALPTGFQIDSAIGTSGSTFDNSTGIWTIGNIDSAASQTLVVTLTVAANAASGVVTNVAELQSVDQTDSDPNNNVDTELTNIIRQVDVSVTKTDNSDPIVAGSGAGNLIYTVTASNAGVSDASGVVIADPFLLILPAGFTLVSAIGSGASSFDTGASEWTIPSLPAGSTETLTLNITVDASAAATTVTNRVEITSVVEADTNASNDIATEDTTVIREVDLALTKTDTFDPVTAGSGVGNVVYTVTLENNGPSDATGVTVFDDLVTNLPTGFSFASATGTGGSTFNSTTGIWTVGDLASGDSRVLTLELTAGAAAAVGTVVNTVSIASVDQTDTVAANNIDSEDTTITRLVDIEVDKIDFADPVIAGSGAGNLTYLVTASNNGPSNASGVNIEDAFLTSLPTGFTIDSATGSNGSTFNSTTGIWTIGDIDAGASETLTVVLTVAANATPGTVVNTASVNSVNETESDLTNNVDNENTTIQSNVDIQVLKSDNNTVVTAGSGAGNLTYVVTATNLGPSNATGVNVTDAFITSLPVGFTLDSATGSDGTTFDASSGVWTIGDLATGAQRTLTLVLTVSGAADPGTVTNTATLTSVDQTDTNAANNSDSEDTPITGSVDLRITKTDVGDPVTAGSGPQNLTYIVTAENLGASPATGVDVLDNFLVNLPAGFQLDTAVGSDGTTFDTTTGIWTIGNIPASGSRTLTVTLTIDSSAAAAVVQNTASVLNLDQQDIDPTNDIATEPTTVVRAVDIVLTKTDNNDPVTAGSAANNLIYTVTAQNIGPSDASGVTISDQLLTALPVGVTLENVVGSDGTTFDATTGIWTIGSLPSGASRTLTVTVTVGSSAAVSTLNNTAELVSVTEPDTDSTNNVATEPTDVIREVDIRIQKVDSADPVIAGSGPSNLTYVITAENNGPSDASGLVVSDQLLTNLPTGIVIDSANGTGATSFNSSTGLWTIGTLPSGESRELTIVLTVSAATTVDRLDNVATIAQLNEPDTDPTNDTGSEDTQIQRRIDLQVTKVDIDDPVQSPGVIEYLITVTNAGPATANNVLLTDTLSSLVSFQSATTSQGTVTNASGVVNGALGSIAPGQVVTISLFVDANIPTGATVNNIVTVTADEVDSDLTNNMSTATTVVEGGLSSISGVVYEDLNNNGQQDANEPPIPNATIALSGVDNQGANVFQTTRTNSLGQYSFDGLQAGRYSLFEIQPGIFLDGAESNGSGLPAQIQDDAFVNLELGAQQQAVALNFGEGLADESKRDFLASGLQVGEQIAPSLPLIQSGTGSLAGNVAVDRNGNGILDADDLGIPAAIVTLSGIDNLGNTVLQTRTTEADGSYEFESLPAGEYNILQTQPPGFGDGPEEAGSILAVAVLDDLFQQISLGDGQSGIDFNFLEGGLGTNYQGPNVAPVIAGNTVQPAANPVISWSTSDQAAVYDVWLSYVSEDGVTQVFRDESVAGNSIQIPAQLTPGEYRLWVRGIDEAGTPGPWSPATELTLVSSTRVELSGTQTIDQTPTLALAVAEGADSYEVVIQNSQGQVIASGEGLSSPSFTVANALEFGSYRAWARTVTDGVTGAWSDGVEFEVNGAPEITSRTTASVFAAPIFEWTDIGADEYEIWINDVTTGTAEFLTTKTSPTNAVLIEEGLAEGRYRFWVRGRDSEGNLTAWSKPQTVEVSDQAVVTGPSGSIDPANPVITWDAVPGATHYDVWLSGPDGLIARETAATGTSHQFDETLTDAAYRVWVRPATASEVGSWSAVQTFTVGGIDQPEIILASSETTDRQPVFEWTAVEGAERYELWINHVGVSNRVIHETNLQSNSFTAPQDLAVGDYRIWVRAIASSGVTSAWSAAASLTIS